MSEKLTMPQLELLNELARGYSQVDEKWPPGKKLVALGYAKGRPTAYGGVILEITDAGRERLSGKAGRP